MRELKFLSNEPLTKENVKNIIHTINQFTEDEVIKTGKDTILATHYKMKDGYHAYVFNFERPIDNKEADDIIGGLYNTIEYDFIVEMEAEIDDSEEEEQLSINEQSPVIEHSHWFMEMMKEGWSYGMEYSKDNKKNPYLKPYHKLTENQRSVLEKSKQRLGYYGLDESLIREKSLNEEKRENRKKDRKEALKKDNDVIVEYNEEHNAFCVLGDNSDFCYAHDNDKKMAEYKREKVVEYMNKRRKKK